MDEEIIRQIVQKIISRITAEMFPAADPRPMPIGVSNRHIHLSTEDLELLFGKGHVIECRRDLSQPGQCAAAETVILAGPKGTIEQVRVLGPVRKQTQVEILRSDTYRLGISAPTRESGKLEGSGGITVIGPKGSIQISSGVIVAKRHIHMTPADASAYGVSDGQHVQVKVAGERGVIFDNTVVRVSENFALEFHIDMDEANCTGIGQGGTAYLMASPGSLAHVQTLGNLQVRTEEVTEKRDGTAVEEPAGLVTEEVVRQAWKRKASLMINKGVICTPLARDAMKQLGVKVVWKQG